VRAALDNYARGVNAFIESLDAKSLPPEFQILQYRPRPWRPADSIVVGKNLAEALSTTWSTDIMRASLADLPADKRAALLTETSPLDVLVVGSDKGSTQKKSARNFSSTQKPGMSVDTETLQAVAEIMQTTERSLERIGLYAEGRAASNNWVVSGKRTATGKPMLANDPHLPPSAPSIWYMTQLSAPGLHVAGVTFPGAPGIILGHNERIAWGATNLGPDVQDVYLEKFDKDNPRRYMTPGGWREAEVRREEIKVRESFTGTATNTVPFDVTVTRHGPIILEKEGRRYALRWTALMPDAVELEGFLFLNRAGNWKEFTDALSRYKGPTQNFVYADVDGHIGYYGAGQIPVRKSGDGSVPYDGSTDDGEWSGFIPFDKLPHSYDPPTGMIVTANQRIAGSDYPYFLTHEWAQPYRARRIFTLLQEKQKLTAEDFRAIQGDTYSYAAHSFAREALKVLKGAEAENSVKLGEALRLFESWDGRVDADSRAALIAANMRQAFRRRILTAAFGSDRLTTYSWSNSDTLIDRIIKERPAEWLPKEFSNYADLLRVSFLDAIQMINAGVGVDESNWTWGSYAKARFPHPLASAPLIGQQFAVAPFPQNGSGGFAGPTVNVGASVSMRLIADTSDWDKTRHGIALGESGLPSSPHWSDQLADWRAVSPRVFPFSKAAVASATKETTILEPAN
ncbi:MAG: penicillin acylase family protein, partial [Pyrinomonadaceae bacterium]